MTDGDRDLARRLPDDFVKCPGSEADCVIELVERYWPSYGTISRAHLAEALMPVLTTLRQSGAQVTERDRGVCEAIVTMWLARQ